MLMIFYSSSMLQPHLVKCFANIRKLYIRRQEQRPPVVLMIKSAEGEILLLPKYSIILIVYGVSRNEIRKYFWIFFVNLI